MDKPETGALDEATLAASDIARLAHVGKAAVSNWRRRFADFPAPVGGTSASPLYSLVQVEAWFTEHDKAFTVSTGERIWPRVRAAVDDLRLGDLVGYLGAFLVFHQRDPRTWKELSAQADPAVCEALSAAITETVPELPGELPQPWPPTWVDILRSVAQFAIEQDHAAAFEFFSERYLETHSRLLSTTSGELAELMVRLAGVAGGTVLDPACGLGTPLVAAHTGGAVRLLGQDSSDTAARLAAVRLLLRGAAVRIAAGDSLRADAHEGVCADAVVCNPPFNERSWGYDDLVGDPRWEYGLPPRGEPELAWVQHCLAHTKPGGHVVISMPAAAATRRPGRRIRSNLLRSGALRAVISLPTSAQTAAPAPDLWVLRRPSDGDPVPTDVLVVDRPTELSAAQHAWRCFMSDAEQSAPEISRVVPIIDLLDDEVDINPARQLASHSDSAATAAEFVPARTKLRSIVAELLATLPGLDVADEPVEPPMTSVGELAKAGVITVHQAPLKTTIDRGRLPVLTAKDVRLGRAPSGRTDAMPGMITTEPGDVVTSAMSREPVARVLIDGGAALGPQLLLLRADPARIDPDFLAGYLRIAGAASAARPQSTSSRIDARRAPIPLLPLTEQRRYGDAFRQLATFEDVLSQATTLGETVLRLGLSGLADGTLGPSR